MLAIPVVLWLANLANGAIINRATCPTTYSPIAGSPQGLTTTVCYDTSHYKAADQGSISGSGDLSLVLQQKCEAACTADASCKAIVGLTQYADSDEASGICFFYDHTPLPRQCIDSSKRAMRVESKSTTCSTDTTTTATISTTTTTATTSSSTGVATTCSEAAESYCGTCACGANYSDGKPICWGVGQCDPTSSDSNPTCSSDADCINKNSGLHCVYDTHGFCPGGRFCTYDIDCPNPQGAPQRLKRDLERVFRAASETKMYKRASEPVETMEDGMRLLRLY